ncbi:MAG: hypothetical protein ACRC4W_05080 [Treponemataceae bacterium]
MNSINQLYAPNFFFPQVSLFKNKKLFTQMPSLALEELEVFKGEEIIIQQNGVFTINKNLDVHIPPKDIDLKNLIASIL